MVAADVAAVGAEMAEGRSLRSSHLSVSGSYRSTLLSHLLAAKPPTTSAAQRKGAAEAAAR